MPVSHIEMLRSTSCHLHFCQAQCTWTTELVVLPRVVLEGAKFLFLARLNQFTMWLNDITCWQHFSWSILVMKLMEDHTVFIWQKRKLSKQTSLYQARSLTVRYILRASLPPPVNVLNSHHSHPFRQCSRHSGQTAMFLSEVCVSVCNWWHYRISWLNWIISDIFGHIIPTAKVIIRMKCPGFSKSG